MQPLDDVQRKHLLKISALLCAIPVCLAPLAGRSSFELASERATFNARLSALQIGNLWTDRPVSVTRDPFVPEPSLTAAGARDEIGTSGIVGMHVTQGDSTGFVLPANRSATETPLSTPGARQPTVTALVTGPSPRALVDDGENVRVVGVGDKLAGSRVLSIDGSGVRLESGTVLPLSEEHP